jgi:VIT1/CCC1 family predicted Fe2+/Mn2+ transporter
MILRIDENTRKSILRFQRNEITESSVYRRLAGRAKGENKSVLEEFSKDELRHYNQWKKYSRQDVSRRRRTILKYSFISRIFGVTFVMKMMEGGEGKARKAYSDIMKLIPKAKSILEDETKHERLLGRMLREEKIGYIGSMVLGLNDALVELTGVLAGLSLTLQTTKLIGTAGLITGVASALSMASSEYLSQKSEKGSKSPRKASFYTGFVYLLTVLLLVAPYFIFNNYLMSLGVTLFDAVLVVFVFTFFISVVQELRYRTKVAQTIAISFGVAGISFVVGLLVKMFLNV